MEIVLIRVPDFSRTELAETRLRASAIRLKRDSVQGLRRNPVGRSNGTFTECHSYPEGMDAFGWHALT